MRAGVQGELPDAGTLLYFFRNVGASNEKDHSALFRWIGQEGSGCGGACWLGEHTFLLVKMRD